MTAESLGHLPQLLRSIGEALFGDRWQSDLSATIGVNDRSVRRWLSGADRIPRGVWRDVRSLLDRRCADLRELQSDLDERLQIVVYRFRRWNQQTGDFDVAPIRATREYIEKVNCEVIFGSGLKVENWEIDDEGRHRPGLVTEPLAVSDVMRTTKGYGFNIVNGHRAPVATFEYADQETADRMLRLLREAVGRSVAVTAHHRPS